MSSVRHVFRSARPSMVFACPISTSSRRMAGPGNAQEHSTTKDHHKIQSQKPLNPHMTNTAPNSELGVGEMEGAKFKVEPLRRTGEDANTMRARLLYQSRKRGTLESDLLMSTFAEAHLREMTPAQMAQYDLFLDENDWDIYYWATQEPLPTSTDTAAQGTDPGKQTGPKLETDAWRQGKPRSGEWAQTVGTFKPAYRPVPARWKDSEILAMLRRHVIHRSAGGVLEGQAEVSGEGLSRSGSKGTGGGGMAFMPPVFQTDRP